MNLDQDLRLYIRIIRSDKLSMKEGIILLVNNFTIIIKHGITIKPQGNW